MESYGNTIHDGEYINILKVLRDNGGPFNWIMKKKNFARHSKKIYETNLGKIKIQKSILGSEKIVGVINEISNQQNINIELIKNEAHEILKNMEENFNIHIIYVVGYSFMKIFNYVLNGVYINPKKMEKVKELIKENPVVFMPTHKSYLDFLLLSIICYDQDMTLPAIAAGMDFQNSKFIGETLRLCGAFYLKRSFGKDKLYWSIFSEYVKSLIIYPDRPIEYFVEGTRSRTQKSLFPKYGLLQMVVEPFLKNDVYDVQIIPVSINYDRVMEEVLYGYELLGFPKPKESTSSLLESRSILKETYGNVYMTFGDPISMRNFFENKINRMNISRNPKVFIQFDNEVKYQIKKLAHIIIKQHNQNSILTVFPLISFLLIQSLGNDDTKNSSKISYEHIYDNVLLYYNLLKKLKVNIFCENKSLDSEIRYQLSLHKNLFSEVSIEILRKSTFEISLSNFSIDNETQAKKIFPNNIVAYIILQNYANQLLHHFIDMAIIGVIFIKNDNYMSNGIMYETMYEDFKYMKELLRYEFVYIFGEERNDYEITISRLIKAQILILNKSNNMIIVNDRESLKLITKLLESFFDGYFLISRIIKQLSGQFLTEKELVSICQLQVGKQIIFNNYKFVQNINTDFIKNVMSTLKHQHILTKYDNEKKELLSINDCRINELVNFFDKIFSLNIFDEEKIILVNHNEINDFISSKI